MGLLEIEVLAEEVEGAAMKFTTSKGRNIGLR